jgi:hypothetical protein
MLVDYAAYSQLGCSFFPAFLSLLFKVAGRSSLFHRTMTLSDYDIGLKIKQASASLWHSSKSSLIEAVRAHFFTSESRQMVIFREIGRRFSRARNRSCLQRNGSIFSEGAKLPFLIIGAYIRIDTAFAELEISFSTRRQITHSIIRSTCRSHSLTRAWTALILPPASFTPSGIHLD